MKNYGDYGGKISIIGMGNVGQAVAMNFYEKRIGRQIYGFGRPGGKTERINARIDEIIDSHQQLGPELITGKYPEELEDSEIVVITAGNPRKPSQKREDLAKENNDIVGKWSGYIKEYAPHSKVIVATNPAGVMTNVALDETGFPRERVMGEQGIDARRMIREISRYLGLTGSRMSGYVLGNHGDDMVIPLECFTIGGTTLEKYLDGIGKVDELKNLEEIAQKMKRASQPLIEGLGQSPWLGPGEYVSRLAEEIYFGPECCDRGTTDSALIKLKGEYGINGVAAVPIVLGREGIIKIIELPSLTNEHREELHEAAEHIKEITDSLYSGGE